MVKKIDEKHFSWIVPLILFVALLLGLAFCDRSEAHAVEPSPSPTPDVVGHAISINVLGIVGAAIFVAAMAWLAYRNMIKHENS